jgi:photosystem II stability/assembly factor-like uncharacterized protein
MRTGRRRPVHPALWVVFLLCPAFVPVATNIFSASRIWISNGPESGNISTLAIDPKMPQTVYAGTDGGVYKSTDGGNHWNRIANLANSNICALAIDPTTPQTVYAGTDVGGVIKSTDGGEAGLQSTRA